MNNHHTKNGITGGIFLVGIGTLMFTNWWWPGIMLVIGLAVSSGLILRGKYLPALITLTFFAAIPLLVTADIPWGVFVPFILIAMGASLTSKSFGKQPNVDRQPKE